MSRTESQWNESDSSCKLSAPGKNTIYNKNASYPASERGHLPRGRQSSWLGGRCRGPGARG